VFWIRRFDAGPKCAGGSEVVKYDVGMTRMLDTAIAKLAALPNEEQDRVGQWLLEELLDGDRWSRAFAGSQDALSKLVAEARADIAQGRATELDPNKL
jgi:hypothetical protein